jgi:GT2 family glycosyltransferase
MAMERAAADLFAFTDGDCIVAGNWLQTAYDCFSRDSELEAVIGAVDIHAPFTPVQFAEYCLNFLPISSSNPPGPFISGATANLLIRRRLVESIGGFPDTPLYVDVRYMNTMTAARAKTMFVPQAIVYHVHSTDIPKLIGRNFHRGKCVWVSLDGTNGRREFVIRWLFPLIGLYRFMAIVSRILRRHRHHLVPFFGSLPLLLTLITVNQGGIIAGFCERMGRHIRGDAGLSGTREQ